MHCKKLFGDATASCGHLATSQPRSHPKSDVSRNMQPECGAPSHSRCTAHSAMVESAFTFLPCGQTEGVVNKPAPPDWLTDWLTCNGSGSLVCLACSVFVWPTQSDLKSLSCWQLIHIYAWTGKHRQLNLTEQIIWLCQGCVFRPLSILQQAVVNRRWRHWLAISTDSLQY